MDARSPPGVAATIRQQRVDIKLCKRRAETSYDLQRFLADQDFGVFVIASVVVANIEPKRDANRPGDGRCDANGRGVDARSPPGATAMIGQHLGMVMHLANDLAELLLQL